MIDELVGSKSTPDRLRPERTAGSPSAQQNTCPLSGGRRPRPKPKNPATPPKPPLEPPPTPRTRHLSPRPLRRGGRHERGLEDTAAAHRRQVPRVRGIRRPQGAHRERPSHSPTRCLFPARCWSQNPRLSERRFGCECAGLA